LLQLKKCTWIIVEDEDSAKLLVHDLSPGPRQGKAFPVSACRLFHKVGTDSGGILVLVGRALSATEITGVCPIPHRTCIGWRISLRGSDDTTLS
jgi:hypothetical protein